jgi:hypothetical protein
MRNHNFEEKLVGESLSLSLLSFSRAQFHLFLPQIEFLLALKMSQTLDRARKLAGRLAGRLQTMQNATSSSASSNSTTTTLQQQTRAASSGARPGEPTPSVKAAAGPHGVINVSG